MSILQAAVLGLWYWVTTWYIGYTWGCAVFGDALVTGLVVGIVMGDVPTAMKCAAVIKPMFLAFAGAGGGIVWDEAAATLGGISVTLVSGLDVSQSVTIAVPLSLLCAQLHTIRRIAFIYPVQKADEYAKTCNTKGIMFMAVCGRRSSSSSSSASRCSSACTSAQKPSVTS